jgi:hypothetical protein
MVDPEDEDTIEMVFSGAEMKVLRDAARGVLGEDEEEEDYEADCEEDSEDEDEERDEGFLAASPPLGLIRANTEALNRRAAQKVLAAPAGGRYVVAAPELIPVKGAVERPATKRTPAPEARREASDAHGDPPSAPGTSPDAHALADAHRIPPAPKRAPASEARGESRDVHTPPDAHHAAPNAHRELPHARRDAQARPGRAHTSLALAIAGVGVVLALSVTLAYQLGARARGTGAALTADQPMGAELGAAARQAAAGIGATDMSGATGAAGTAGSVGPAGSAEATAASASTPDAGPAPVRFRNPFDATEVFEFPAGTSDADARDAVAALLLKRAQERQQAERAKRRRSPSLVQSS